jgi:hypothetical protein
MMFAEPILNDRFRDVESRCRPAAIGPIAADVQGCPPSGHVNCCSQTSATLLSRPASVDQ